MNAIYSRRSIRKYTSDPVPMDLIEEFIKAGMNAPSAGNEQPWHFIIINDRKLLDEITTVHPHSNMLKQATIAVLVCGDLTLEKHQGYWVQDCSAATENILLAVADKGLGSVWLGVYPRQDRVEGLRKLLHIPEQVVPFSLLPIGYPDEEKERKNEFHRERIHRNVW